MEIVKEGEVAHGMQNFFKFDICSIARSTQHAARSKDSAES
jgi:hypothetical protein